MTIPPTCQRCRDRPFEAPTPGPSGGQRLRSRPMQPGRAPRRGSSIVPCGEVAAGAHDSPGLMRVRGSTAPTTRSTARFNST